MPNISLGRPASSRCAAFAGVRHANWTFSRWQEYFDASSELRRDGPLTARGRRWSSVSPRPFRFRCAKRMPLLAAGLRFPTLSSHPISDTADHRSIDSSPEAKSGALAQVELLMRNLSHIPVLVLYRHWNTLRMKAGAQSAFLALFPGCDSGRLIMELVL